MSVCDTCPKPGNCCRSISLNGGSFAMEAETTEQAERAMENANLANAGSSTDVRFPMPFRPLFKASNGTGWMWWCPNLSTETGRCMDYENRPYACRDYQPGADKLCVLHGQIDA